MTRHKKGCIICGLSILIAVATLFGEDVSYAMNDDVFLNMIVAGAFGETVSAYQIFIGYPWGTVLFALYRMLPGINCYFWSMLFLNTVSVISVSMLTLRRIENLGTVALITVFINLLLKNDAYLNLQFTKSAYLYCAAGIAWIIISFNQDHQYWIVGSVFFILGFLFRRESFYLSAAFGCVLLMYCLCIKRIPFRVMLKGLCPLVIILSIAWFMNAAAYSSPEWREFQRFNRARAVLEDHVGINYESNRELYRAAGVSDLQARMIDARLYIDTEIITADVMETVAEIESEMGYSYRMDRGRVSETLSSMIGTVSAMLLPQAVLLLFLVILILGNRESRIAVTGGMLFIISIYWYFVCENRIVWRAEFGVWLLVLIVPLVYLGGMVVFKTEQFKCSRWMIYGVTGLLLLCFLGQMAIQFRSVKDKVVFRDRGSKATVFSAENTSFDRTGEFHFGQDTEITMNPVEITKSVYEGLFRHYCYINSWVASSPTGLYYARETAGIEGNPVRALIERERTYYLGDVEMADLLAEDLERIYGMSVRKDEISEGKWRFFLESS